MILLRGVTDVGHFTAVRCVLERSATERVSAGTWRLALTPRYGSQGTAADEHSPCATAD